MPDEEHRPIGHPLGHKLDVCSNQDFRLAQFQNAAKSTLAKINRSVIPGDRFLDGNTPFTTKGRGQEAEGRREKGKKNFCREFKAHA